MEEENVSQQTKDAFNPGYVLQKHEAELLDKVLQSNDQKNEYVQGLVKGMQQHELEKIEKRQQRIKETNQKKTRHL